MEKSLQKIRFHKDVLRCFLWTLHFDHCGGSIQWIKTRQDYEPAFKTPILGQITSIGLGKLNQYRV